MQRAHQYFGVELTSANNGPSLGGVFLVLLFALVCTILRREPSTLETPSAASAKAA